MIKEMDRLENADREDLTTKHKIQVHKASAETIAELQKQMAPVWEAWASRPDRRPRRC